MIQMLYTRSTTIRKHRQWIYFKFSCDTPFEDGWRFLIALMYQFNHFFIFKTLFNVHSVERFYFI